MHSFRVNICLMNKDYNQLELLFTRNDDVGLAFNWSELRIRVEIGPRSDPLEKFNSKKQDSVPDT